MSWCLCGVPLNLWARLAIRELCPRPGTSHVCEQALGLLGGVDTPTQASLRRSWKHRTTAVPGGPSNWLTPVLQLRRLALEIRLQGAKPVFRQQSGFILFPEGLSVAFPVTGAEQMQLSSRVPRLSHVRVVTIRHVTIFPGQQQRRDRVICSPRRDSTDGEGEQEPRSLPTAARQECVRAGGPTRVSHSVHKRQEKIPSSQQMLSKILLKSSVHS